MRPAGHRIVAAGIEDQDVGADLIVEAGQDRIHVGHRSVGIDARLQPHIDRHEIVAAVDLHAVAGIIEHRDLRARRLGRKSRASSAWLRVEIDAFGPRTRCRAGSSRSSGVVDRIWQRLEVGIGAVADHQRDAPAGVGPAAFIGGDVDDGSCYGLDALVAIAVCNRSRRHLRQQLEPDFRGRLVGLAAGVDGAAFQRGLEILPGVLVVAFGLVGEAALVWAVIRRCLAASSCCRCAGAWQQPDRLVGVGDGAIDVALRPKQHAAVD